MRFEGRPIYGHLETDRPMLFAIFLLAVFILASGVTVFAFVTARDGYEDRFGFHETSVAQAMSDGAKSPTNSSAQIPPFAAAG